MVQFAAVLLVFFLSSPSSSFVCIRRFQKTTGGMAVSSDDKSIDFRVESSNSNSYDPESKENIEKFLLDIQSLGQETPGKNSPDNEPMGVRPTGHYKSWKTDMRKRNQIISSASSKAFDVENLIVEKLTNQINKIIARSKNPKFLQRANRRSKPLRALYRVMTARSKDESLIPHSSSSSDNALFEELIFSLYAAKGNHFFQSEPKCSDLSISFLEHAAKIGDLKSASFILGVLFKYYTLTDKGNADAEYLKMSTTCYPTVVYKLVAGMLLWAIDKGLYTESIELCSICFPSSDFLQVDSINSSGISQDKKTDKGSYREIIVGSSIVAALRAHISNFLILESITSIEKDVDAPLLDSDIRLKIHRIKADNVYLERLLLSMIDREDFMQIISPNHSQVSAICEKGEIAGADASIKPEAAKATKAQLQVLSNDKRWSPHQMVSICFDATVTGMKKASAEPISPQDCNKTVFTVDLLDTLAAADGVNDTIVSSYIMTLLDVMQFDISRTMRASRQRNFAEMHTGSR